MCVYQHKVCNERPVIGPQRANHEWQVRAAGDPKRGQALALLGLNGADPDETISSIGSGRGIVVAFAAALAAASTGGGRFSLRGLRFQSRHRCRRQLDGARARPGQAFSRCVAAAIFQALRGRAATAGMTLAGEGDRRILRDRSRQRQRIARHACDVRQQRQAGNNPAGSRGSRKVGAREHQGCLFVVGGDLSRANSPSGALARRKLTAGRLEEDPSEKLLASERSEAF